jgi:multicomponent K+:H+ antiporter subunit G
MPWQDALISFFLVLGAGFALIGSIGLVRFPDFYLRLHGPTKATTLGVGGVLIASVLFFSFRQPGLSLHELLVTFFLFITAPVSAHLLARAARHCRVPIQPDTRPPGSADRGDRSDLP